MRYLSIRDLVQNIKVEFGMIARVEEALINWSGQKVGVAKDNSCVWSSTLQTIYLEYFVFLCTVNNC